MQQGILIERAKNIYTFSHLTFQEYFTAKFIDDNNLLDEHITDFINDPRWREVFLLLCGMAKSGSDKILNAINEQIKNDVKNQPFLNQLLDNNREKSTLDIRLFILIIKIALLSSNQNRYERNMEPSLGLIARELELKNSYDLIGTYIMDFRFQIDDHYNVLIGVLENVLKYDANSSDYIKNVLLIFNNGRAKEYRKHIAKELLKITKIGQLYKATVRF